MFKLKVVILLLFASIYLISCSERNVLLNKEDANKELNINYKITNGKYFMKWDSYFALFFEEDIIIDLPYINYKSKEKVNHEENSSKTYIYKLVDSVGKKYTISLINKLNNLSENDYSLETYVFRISNLPVGEYTINQLIIEENNNEFKYDIGNLQIEVFDQANKFEGINIGKRSSVSNSFDWYRTEIINDTDSNVCIVDMKINLTVPVEIKLNTSKDFNNYNNRENKPCLEPTEQKTYEFNFIVHKKINDFVAMTPVVKIEKQQKFIILPRAIYSKSFESSEEILDMIQGLKKTLK